jgi:cation:H+ antiporter
MTGDVLTDETTEMTEDNLKQEPVVTRAVVLRQTVLFLIGIGMVVVGADMLVGNGVSLAELLGVPTLLISLIFTSLGTSLPELVTTITSIRKKATNMGIGNLIGANVMNIAQVLGAASLFRALPLTDSRSLMLFQLPFTLLLSVLILGFGLLQKKTRRWNGAVLIGLYVVFLVLNLMRTDFPVLGPFLFGAA